MSENEENFLDGDFDDAQLMSPVVRSEGDLAKRMPNSDIVKFRDELVQEYHKGATGLKDRLKQAGMEDYESLVIAMIDEILRETDHLLGNELVATHNGELRDSSIISVKRADLLEKAIKALQTKQQFEKQSGIDVDSPSMIIIFRFFMTKASEAFSQMGVDEEISDLFFRKLGEITNEWKKELREEFEALKSPK